MLDEKTTIDPTAIEKHICDPFSKCDVEEMNKEITETFIEFMMSDENKIDLAPIRKKAWQLVAMEKRIEVCLQFTIESRVKIFILLLSDGKMGIINMYLYYIQSLCKNKGIQHFTFKMLSDVFPTGFPTETALEKIWRNQKVKRQSKGGSDNLIDYQSAAMSIMFKN